jgi:hypothetical protein
MGGRIATMVFVKHLITIAIAAGVLLSSHFAVAADEDPVKAVELRLEGACDANNKRLWLHNNHPSRAIIATLRWNLFGSKRIINDQFRVVAAGRLEIGCAAQADIVSAVFAPEA